MSQAGTKVTASSLGSVTTLTPDSGGAIGPNGSGTIFIHGGPNIATSGAGNTVTVGFTGTLPVANGGTGDVTLPIHTVLLGNGTSAINETAVGTNGQVLIGSTAADPAFSTLTSTGGTIVFTTGAHTLNLETSGSTSNSFVTNSGTATPSAGVLNVVGGTNITTSGSGSTVTINLAATIPVSLGGTGDTSLTAHGVLVGEGTSAVAVTAVGSNGQVLIGATAADPAFATLTSTGGTITFTAGANTLNLEADSGGLVWTVITGASQALVKTNGYFANNAGTISFSLPGIAAVGDTFTVAGMNNATGWTITQAAGQTMHFGTYNTTTGVGGSLSSTAIYDTIRFVCNIANTDFVVVQSIGNITVV